MNEAARNWRAVVDSYLADIWKRACARCGE